MSANELIRLDPPEAVAPPPPVNNEVRSDKPPVLPEPLPLPPPPMASVIIDTIEEIGLELPEPDPPMPPNIEERKESGSEPPPALAGDIPMASSFL